MRIGTRTLAGTATLAALTIVLDYTWKYSNLKLPFPPLTYLKFDFTGIPIVLATLLFGFIPGAVTSLIAAVGILARSGKVLDSSMKGLAEFATILGIAIGLKLLKRLRKPGSSVLGITSRVLVMAIANLTAVYVGIMPLDPNVPLIIVTLLIGVFNTIQGALTVYGGFVVYEALRRRAPHLAKIDKQSLGD